MGEDFLGKLTAIARESVGHDGPLAAEEYEKALDAIEAEGKRIGAPEFIAGDVGSMLLLRLKA